MRIVTRRRRLAQATSTPGSARLARLQATGAKRDLPQLSTCAEITRMSGTMLPFRSRTGSPWGQAKGEAPIPVGVPDHIPVFDISADQTVEELVPEYQMSQQDAPHERAMSVADLFQPDKKPRRTETHSRAHVGPTSARLGSPPADSGRCRPGSERGWLEFDRIFKRGSPHWRGSPPWIAEAISWRDATCREAMRAALWRESDPDRRRLGRGIRGCTTRRWGDPSQAHCNAHGYQDVPWQKMPQNNAVAIFAGDCCTGPPRN